MNKEQIINELMEMDARLSGLYDTIKFINSQTLDGIDELNYRSLSGIIYTLEQICGAYYKEYNSLSGKITDFINKTA